MVALSDHVINTVCRHDNKKTCLLPSTACKTCQINIDHALKLQDSMENFQARWNNGDGDTRNWGRDE
jgi:hypothetical protein